MFRDNLYPGMLMNITYFSVTFQSDHLTRPFVCTISHHFVALLLAEWLLMFLCKIGKWLLWILLNIMEMHNLTKMAMKGITKVLLMITPAALGLVSFFFAYEINKE